MTFEEKLNLVIEYKESDIEILKKAGEFELAAFGEAELLGYRVAQHLINEDVPMVFTLAKIWAEKKCGNCFVPRKNHGDSPGQKCPGYEELVA